MGELVPDEARDAARAALWDETELDPLRPSDQLFIDALTDRALDAAAPLIAAAATSRPREAIEAVALHCELADEWALATEVRALASPVSDDTGGTKP